MADFKNFLDPILIILVIIFIGFSIYIYRVTNPALPKRIKYLLTTIRSFALILLLLAIFNSITGFTKTETIEPVNLFFVDNSNSMAIKDSTLRAVLTNKFISDFSNGSSNLFYSFGSGIDSLKGETIDFSEKSTSFSDIEKFIAKQSFNISAVTILSDGILTDGANPVYGFEKMEIPVFTVGIGDTTGYNDIILHEPRYNELVYRNRTTAIEAGITNKGFAGKSSVVKLYEEDNLVEQKNIVLNQSGFDNIKFSYTPKAAGGKRLRISVTPLNNESTIHNNSKSFIIRVLSDKIKTLLISSTPSPDLSILSGMLLKDERVKLKSIVELTGNKIIKGGNSDFPIDSTDVYILIDYPSKNSDINTFNQIKTNILKKNKPFLITSGSSIYSARLNKLGPALPFSLANISADEVQIGVYADNPDNSFIKPSESALWSSLPPVMQLKSEFTPAPGSQVILKASIKNIQTEIPVIITRQLNNIKSSAIIAGNFWKWKLQAASQTEFLFDNLISNLLQWLNTPAEKKFFSIKSGKKVYLNGEKIELTAQLYDNLFNSVENADIKLTVKSKSNSYETILPYSGGGIYSTGLENSEMGNLKITASVKLFNTIYSDSLNLFIDQNDLERINGKMDTGFLKQLAFGTNGSFFYADDYSGLKDKLEKLSGKKRESVKEYSEFRFAENKIILIILIILFALEWFVRKTYRLI